jgi:hypothetical protein|tara:strand:+ start:733 stop:1041 length:309 start_codon:yes stop_codon:yes gene_type:complete
MAQIIRRKSDNKVFYCLDNAETANLTSTGFNFTLNNGARTLTALDIKSSTHELLTDITPPTTFAGSGIFTYDDSSWAIDSDLLNNINAGRAIHDSPNIVAEV